MGGACGVGVGMANGRVGGASGGVGGACGVGVGRVQ